MPTALQAFHVGYGLNMVGVYFEGASMIAHVGAGAPEELVDLCQQQMAALTQGAASTRWHIKLVGAAMEAAGLPVPQPPAGVDDYAGWSEGIAETYYPALEGNETVAAYLLGWYLSGWIQYANMGVIALFLKDAQPGWAATEEALASIMEDLAEAVADVGNVAPGIPLAAAALPHVDRCLELITGAPPLDDASQELLDVADDYQEALHELTEAVERLEKALG